MNPGGIVIRPPEQGTNSEAEPRRGASYASGRRTAKPEGLAVSSGNSLAGTEAIERVTVRVHADPPAAFDVVVEESDEWANRSEAMRDLMARAVDTGGPGWLPGTTNSPRPTGRSGGRERRHGADQHRRGQDHRRRGDSRGRSRPGSRLPTAGGSRTHRSEVGHVVRSRPRRGASFGALRFGGQQRNCHSMCDYCDAYSRTVVTPT